MTFVRQLYIARNTASEARKALQKAEIQTTIDPVIAEMAQARNPEGYAKMLVQVAAIEATIPALRAAVADAETVLLPLEDKACHRCSGTGEYGGASRYMRNGSKYCFGCNGKGHQ